MSNSNNEKLVEVKSETNILARSFVANGTDPVLTFSAMLAGTLDFGVIALQYNDEQMIKLLEHVLAERKQAFATAEYKTAKAQFMVRRSFLRNANDASH